MGKTQVGVAGIGTYIPKTFMSAKAISEATKGVWSEAAIIDKLGIVKKTIAGQNEGTQEMGDLAANGKRSRIKLNCFRFMMD